MCLNASSHLKDSLRRKLWTLWHCSRLRSVALYLWLIVVISAEVIDRCSIIWAYLFGRWLWSVRHKADSLILQIQRSGRKRSERLMYEQSHRDDRLVICIIVCLSWAVNHYRDNAITYKAQRDKNARELKLANAAITGHADASAWCCCARCKIHEGVSWC